MGSEMCIRDRSIARPVTFKSTSNLRRSLCELLALLRLGGALGRYSQFINRRILLTEGRMTSGVTSASSGSLVDPEPRSATQSPTLWESNHLLSSTLECGNTDYGSIMVTKLED